jgi:hypothetical protein
MTSRATLSNVRASILVALLTTSAPGCATVSLLNLKTEKIATADAEHPAIEVLAVWQAAEGPGAKGIPTRGFAGQIFFFTQDRAQPVAVDGTVRIYVFDDHGNVQEQARPLHQYDFDRDSWHAHLQLPKIGPTYGVFIPYPRNDYHQAVCSLRVRFTPSKGRPLYSASSTLVLPGPALKADDETAQLSPIRALTKKLQAQQQLARGGQTQSFDNAPKPFGMTGQGAETPMAGLAQTAANGSGNINAFYATGQVQPTGADSIVQASGSVRLANADQTMNSAGGSPGWNDLQPRDAASASGHFSLQPANVNAENSDGTAAATSLGDSDGSPPTGGAASPSIAHPSHPLAD